MVQFVPYFKGELKPEYSRLTTVQRCLRTTDIENIGHTARHLSFFEMLGNFSIGDYFKKEAIPWAWEFITKEIGLDTDRIWISVFTDDDEAYDIWNKDVGVREDRIIRLGESENFWSMGEVGPCGPCSEMLYDLGDHLKCGPDCEPGCDCDRFLEVWNLVFMQYNRQKDGKLEPLPKKNIDTGMGLERVCAILQGAETAFDTDLLKPIVDAVTDVTGAEYGKDKKKDVSIKIVADHARAITFMANDGILPSNESRGYVLRRLTRRAIRHGRMLGSKGLFLHELVDAVIDKMGGVYEDVKKNRLFIKEIIGDEEKRFDKTLKQGLTLLDAYIEKSKKDGKKEIDSALVFKLYDTSGFPFELTKEIAEENGLSVHEKKFDELMQEQRRRTQEMSAGVFVQADVETYAEILENIGKTKFTGYSEEMTEVHIAAILKDGRIVGEAKNGDEVEIILNRTPFYAEMGGQIGDRGVVRTKSASVTVYDTVTPLPDLIVHKGKIDEGGIKKGDKASASIDSARRAAIRRNHTGTHLLHWALRRVLGEHVRQGGSLVDAVHLRFDFTHGQVLKPEDITKIETMVNRQILENHQVKSYTTTFKYATESGAIAFFGEKYGKYVRVLEINDFSRELCGGTHVSRTGDIGQLKITNESSVGANLRRIEAVTGMEAYGRAKEQAGLVKSAEASLKATGTGILDHIKALQETVKRQAREIETLKARFSAIEVASLLSDSDEINGVKVVTAKIKDKDMSELRVIADEIRNRARPSVMVLGSTKGERASLLVAVSKDMAGEKVSADKIIKEVGHLIEGGGGGKPDLAQAGGRDAAGLDRAIDQAGRKLRELLK
jgi:alanyl-tRNA synthetase